MNVELLDIFSLFIIQLAARDSLLEYEVFCNLHCFVLMRGAFSFHSLKLRIQWSGLSGRVGR